MGPFVFLSFRSKLFAISLLLLALFVASMGLYLHQTLGGWTESRIETDLQSRAQLIVNALDFSDDTARQIALIGALGEEEAQRITLVAADGTVLADTHLSSAEIETVENHAGRPEVRAALEDGFGLSRRHSTSVDTDMLYAALPTAESDAVVRVALPLDDVDEALSHLRLLLIIGALFGISAAIFMSSLASTLMSRTLQNVLDRARSNQPSPASGAESSTASLQQLTQHLELTLDELAEQRNRFRAVLNGMSEGVVATDEDLMITMSNRTARRLLQIDVDPDADPGQTSLRRWLPADVTKSLVEDQEDSVEFNVTTPAHRWIRVRVTPRSDPRGYIFVFHDVTAIRQLETVRRDFVANVSHELRTPVTIIQANAETLIDGALDDSDHALSFTQGIHRNAERLSRLIANLLDLAQIEAGEMDFDLQPQKLSTTLAQIVDEMRRYADVEGTQIHCSVPDDLEVYADRDALEQISFNLLENALKYGGDGLIEVTARRRDTAVLIEISDEGPGIAEELADRIFERFYRVDGGRSSKTGGTGLGLSIVKHLVRSMDGEVGYRMRDGGGSIFWFTLPAPPLAQ